MQLKRSDEGQAAVVEIKGRLDGSTSPALLAALQELIAERPLRLVLDLRELEYVSSAGLRTLLMAAKQAQSQPTAFMLCALRPNVAELFEISGLTQVFTIHAERAAALGQAA